MNQHSGFNKPRSRRKHWLKRFVPQLLFAFLVVLLFLGTAQRQEMEVEAGIPPLPGKWRLLFRDEFNGRRLDTRKWYICFPWYPKAVQNQGCPGNSEFENPGTSNGELQWYQPNNITLQNGMLRITGKREKKLDPRGNSYDYTAAIITTQYPVSDDDSGSDSDGDKKEDSKDRAGFQFQYGYVEARVRVAKGRGLWSQFWIPTVTTDWPPEIDMMEILGHDTHMVHMTLHYGPPDSPKEEGDSWGAPDDFATDWHTFAVDWQPNLLVWYVDGIERARVNHDVPREKMYLVFNLSIGGNWPGRPDQTTLFPAHYDIDYVRVWQRGDDDGDDDYK